jgi:signal peptidase II
MKKTMSKKKLNLVFIFSAVFIIFADQLTKFWIKAMPEEAFPITVIPNLFYIKRITNTGIAFGMFQNMMNILIAVSIIAVLLIIFLKIKLQLDSFFFNLGMGLLLGGTIGNLIDRILFREVTDFLSLDFFAVFNVADSFINIGFAIIAIVMIGSTIKNNRLKKPDAKKEDGPPPS